MVGQLRGIAQQLVCHARAAGRDLGRDEVRDARHQSPIVGARQDAAGPAQVVVQEPRLGERAADVVEEAVDLAVREPAPGRQRDLEGTRAKVVGDADALQDGGHGQADDAHHRRGAAASRLVQERRRDGAEARGVHRVTLARRAEHVLLGEAGRDQAPDLLPEQFLDERVPVIPWHRARDEDALGMPKVRVGHGWISRSVGGRVTRPVMRRAGATSNRFAPNDRMLRSSAPGSATPSGPAGPDPPRHAAAAPGRGSGTMSATSARTMGIATRTSAAAL